MAAADSYKPRMDRGLWLGVGIIGLALPVRGQDRLDAEDLLRFLDASGSGHVVATAADWEKRRGLILAGMASVAGPFPDESRRVSLDPEVVEEADCGTYLRRLVTYRAEADSRVPAYLCIPKSALTEGASVPAVLCLHPTDNVVGHGVAVGLGGKPGRHYAAELAERGYVTLSPSYPQLAAYWPNLDALGYRSGTMKAIWDNVRGLDYLETLPFVDPSAGFGAIGHSLGGHNAIYTAVHEPRITALVSSCGFDAYPDYYDGREEVWFFGQGWCQTRYMPLLSNFRGRLREIPFDFPELLGALAPRPVFVNAPLHDTNFRWQSVDRCAQAARPVYRLLGSGEAPVVRHPDCGHDFPDAVRAEAYAFLDSVLQPPDSAPRSAPEDFPR